MIITNKRGKRKESINTFLLDPGKPGVRSMRQDVTQDTKSIAWVHCASGKVSLLFLGLSDGCYCNGGDYGNRGQLMKCRMMRCFSAPGLSRAH